MDFASTKSNYSPNWRVQNLFDEYEMEVTRQFDKYEFFLMSNPVIVYMFMLFLIFKCSTVISVVYVNVNLCNQQISTLPRTFIQCQHTQVHSMKGTQRPNFLKVLILA